MYIYIYVYTYMYIYIYIYIHICIHTLYMSYLCRHRVSRKMVGVEELRRDGVEAHPLPTKDVCARAYVCSVCIAILTMI